MKKKYIFSTDQLIKNGDWKFKAFGPEVTFKSLSQAKQFVSELNKVYEQYLIMMLRHYESAHSLWSRNMIVFDYTVNQGAMNSFKSIARIINDCANKPGEQSQIELIHELIREILSYMCARFQSDSNTAAVKFCKAEYKALDEAYFNFRLKIEKLSPLPTFKIQAA